VKSGRIEGEDRERKEERGRKEGDEQLILEERQTFQLTRISRVSPGFCKNHPLTRIE